jgi:hypothetical protein
MVWIDHLNFKNEKPIYNTRMIRTMHSTITQLSFSLSLYIYICIAENIETLLKFFSQQLNVKLEFYYYLRTDAIF